MSTAELDNYRSAVVDNDAGAEIETAIEKCQQVGLILTDETLKRVPADLCISASRETLLRHKNLVLTTGNTVLPSQDICDVVRMTEILSVMVLINAWLMKSVS